MSLTGDRDSKSYMMIFENVSALRGCFCALLLVQAFFCGLPASGEDAADRPEEEVLRTALKLHSSGKSEEAVEGLKKIIESGAGDVGVSGLMGIILSEMGAARAKEAVRLLESAVKSEPGNADYHLGLCRACRRLGGIKLEEAASHCRRAMELDASRYPVYRELGLVYNALGDFKKAARVWEMGAEVSPGNYIAFYQAAIGLMRTGDTAKPPELLKKALSLAGKSAPAPDYSRIKLALGNAFLKSGRTNEALEMYTQALEHYREGSLGKQARERIAFAASVLKKKNAGPDPKQGDKPSRLRKGNASPEFAECMSAAQQLHRENRLPEAEAGFRRCVVLDRASASARISLAGVLMMVGKLSEAKSEFALSLSLLNPGDQFAAYCHSRLGDIAFKQNDIEAAGAHYQKTLEIEPRDVNARIGMGKYYEAKTNWQKSAQYYRDGLEIDPGNVLAQKGLNNAEIFSMDSSRILSEMKLRQAVPPARTGLTEDELAMFRDMRRVEGKGAVDYLRPRVHDLAGYIIEKKEGTRIRLFLTLSGFNEYKEHTSQEAIRLFESKDISVKYVFLLKDYSGRPLFDSSGKLTPEGVSVYEKALNGRKGWLLPDEPPPGDGESEDAGMAKKLAGEGYDEISESEYLWLLKVTECAEAVMRAELNFVPVKGKKPGAERYFIYGREDKPGWILGTYIARYRNGDTSVPGARPTAFFGTGPVEGRRLCHNGKVWRGE